MRHVLITRRPLLVIEFGQGIDLSGSGLTRCHCRALSLVARTNRRHPSVTSS